MNRSGWEALVKSNVRLAQRSPERYRTIAWVWLAIGTILPALFVFAAALLAIALVIALLHGYANILTMFLGLASATAAVTVAKALVEEVPPAEGVPLSRTAAPRLWALIEDVGKSVGAASPDAVHVLDDMSAWAQQRPRMGLASHTNIVGVGLPLLENLSVPELRAVLAHEMAHLRQGDGRFGSRMWRTMRAWKAIQSGLTSRQQVIAKPMMWFARWYLPRLEAVSFAQRRLAEIQADRLAGETAGNEIAAMGLLRTCVRGLELDTGPLGLSQLHRAPIEHERPVRELFAVVVAASGRQLEAFDCLRYLAYLLNSATDEYNEHPALIDRLASWGMTIGMCGAPGSSEAWAIARKIAADLGEQSAAAQLLGASWERTRSVVAEYWEDNAKEWWQQTRLDLLEARRRYFELSGDDADSADDQFEMATLAMHLWGEDQCLPHLSSCLRIKPDHARGNLRWGQMLVRRNDPTGVGFIEHAIGLDARTRIEGARTLSAYHLWNGDVSVASELARDQRAAVEQFRNGQDEAESVLPGDRFQPACISPEVVRQLKVLLEPIKYVARAHLVCKVTQHYEGIVYVLVLVPKRGLVSTEAHGKAAKQLSLGLGPFMDALLEPNDHARIVWTAHGSAKLGKAAASVPDAVVFDRKKHRRAA